MARPVLVAVMAVLVLLGPVMGHPWRGPATVAIVAGWWAALRYHPQEVGR